MTNERIEGALAVIHATLELHRMKMDSDGLMSEPTEALFEYAIRDMEDQLGFQAVMEVCTESEYPPTPGAIRKRYAELVGAVGGETPGETIRRRESTRELQRQAEEEHRRHVERCRERYGAVASDPARRAQFLADRGFPMDAIQRSSPVVNRGGAQSRPPEPDASGKQPAFQQAIAFGMEPPSP